MPVSWETELSFCFCLHEPGPEYREKLAVVDSSSQWEGNSFPIFPSTLPSFPTVVSNCFLDWYKLDKSPPSIRCW